MGVEFILYHSSSTYDRLAKIIEFQVHAAHAEHLCF